MPCQDVTLGTTSFDGEFAKVEVDLKITKTKIGLQMNADDDVGLFLGVMLAEPENSRAGFSSGEVIEFFPGHTGDLETFHHGPTTASIPVDHVVVFRLVLIEDVDNEVVFSDEDLVGDLDDAHGAVAGESDDVVEARAFLNGLVALHGVTGEAFFTIHVERVVGHDHLLGGNAVKAGEFSAAATIFAVFLFDVLIPLDGVLGEAAKVFLHLSDLIFEALDKFVGLEGVIFRDALNLDLGEANDVFLCDLALEQFEERLQALPDFFDHRFPGFAFLDAAVNAILNEDFFEAGEVPAFLQFTELDLELLL